MNLVVTGMVAGVLGTLVMDSLNLLFARTGMLSKIDVRVHLIFIGRLHESIAGTGSVSLAAASRIPGSVLHGLTINPDGDILRIGHPSGVIRTRAKVHSIPDPPYVEFDDLGYSRTARRIMEGRAFYPRSSLDLDSDEVSSAP